MMDYLSAANFRSQQAVGALNAATSVQTRQRPQQAVRKATTPTNSETFAATLDRIQRDRLA